MYAFFWVTPWRLNCICQRFGTLCSIFKGAYKDKKKQTVPKLWNIKFRSRGIAQKKAYNIQNTAKV